MASIFEVPDGVPTSERVARLKTYAAYKRYTVETGGVALKGVGLIATDHRTQGVLTAAYVKASANPAYQIDDWKSAGGYVSLDAAALIAIADAVEAHVRACFAKNREVDDAIDAGAVTTVAEIDALVWPT